MFCSTIIPTIGRSTLARTVSSVLDQGFSLADFEIIVVNDSGQPLAETDWWDSERVTVLQTDHRERSVARNTGAAIALKRAQKEVSAIMRASRDTVVELKKNT